RTFRIARPQQPQQQHREQNFGLEEAVGTLKFRRGVIANIVQIWRDNMWERNIIRYLEFSFRVLPISQAVRKVVANIPEARWSPISEPITAFRSLFYLVGDVVVSQNG